MINRKRFASFFKSQDSTFPPETVLTYDTWNDYLYAVTDHKYSKYSKGWDDAQLERSFRAIESSEEITQNFFAIPERSRQSIIRLAKFEFSNAEIIAYTNIFHRLDRLYPKIESSRLLFNDDSYDGRKGYKPKISDEFVEYVYRFVDVQKEDLNDIMWALCSGSLLYVLIPIYGERRIMEVIDLWVANASSSNHLRLDDFITLLDRFDDLDTSYPLSWLLGVVSSDISKKLQMVTK